MIRLFCVESGESFDKESEYISELLVFLVPLYIAVPERLICLPVSQRPLQCLSLHVFPSNRNIIKERSQNIKY